MKSILMILLLAVLAQSQHTEEDRKILLKAGENQDDRLQNVDDDVAKGAGKDIKNLTRKPPLKEFQDHAELNDMKKKSEKAPPASPTPSPMLVTEEITTAAVDEEATTEQAPLVPSPVRVPSDTVTGEDKPTTPAVTKKPTNLNKPDVKRKELIDADVKLTNATKSRNFRMKGVSLNDSTPAVYENKDSSLPIDIEKNNKTGGTDGKSKGTSLNMPTLDTPKKVFSPKKSEADMSFSGSTSTTPKPEEKIIKVIALPNVTSPAPKVYNPEPPMPPTSEPSVTPSETHSKPVVATDNSNKESNTSYTPAVVGLVLLVTIIVTVIVIGYRRLQDVWSRRHYARMENFLIDGMYDV